MIIKSYEDLDVWKISIELTEKVYILSNNKYFNQDYSLKDQIRRSSVSISSNIAEGFERNSQAEFKRFLCIAKGSCGELRTQLLICSKLSYITEDDYKDLSNLSKALSSKLGSLINHIYQKISKA